MMSHPVKRSAITGQWNSGVSNQHLSYLGHLSDIDPSVTYPDYQSSSFSSYNSELFPSMSCHTFRTHSPKKNKSKRSIVSHKLTDINPSMSSSSYIQRKHIKGHASSRERGRGNGTTQSSQMRYSMGKRYTEETFSTIDSFEKKASVDHFQQPMLFNNQKHLITSLSDKTQHSLYVSHDTHKLGQPLTHHSIPHWSSQESYTLHNQNDGHQDHPPNRHEGHYQTPETTASQLSHGTLDKHQDIVSTFTVSTTGSASTRFPSSQRLTTHHTVGLQDSKKLKPMKLQFYRTKMCPWVLSIGHCRKGMSCRYAHSSQELRPLPDLSKTKLCTSLVETGQCDNPRRCKYAHSYDELRATQSFSKTKLCPLWLDGGCIAGQMCRFAHGENELRTTLQKGTINEYHSLYHTDSKLSDDCSIISDDQYNVIQLETTHLPFYLQGNKTTSPLLQQNNRMTTQPTGQDYNHNHVQHTHPCPKKNYCIPPFNVMKDPTSLIPTSTRDSNKLNDSLSSIVQWDNQPYSLLTTQDHSERQLKKDPTGILRSDSIPFEIYDDSTKLSLQSHRSSCSAHSEQKDVQMIQTTNSSIDPTDHLNHTITLPMRLDSTNDQTMKHSHSMSDNTQHVYSALSPTSLKVAAHALIYFSTYLQYPQHTPETNHLNKEITLNTSGSSIDACNDTLVNNCQQSIQLTNPIYSNIPTPSTISLPTTDYMDPGITLPTTQHLSYDEQPRSSLPFMWTTSNHHHSNTSCSTKHHTGCHHSSSVSHTWNVTSGSLPVTPMRHNDQKMMQETTSLCPTHFLPTGIFSPLSNQSTYNTSPSSSSSSHPVTFIGVKSVTADNNLCNSCVPPAVSSLSDHRVCYKSITEPYLTDMTDTVSNFSNVSETSHHHNIYPITNDRTIKESTMSKNTIQQRDSDTLLNPVVQSTQLKQKRLKKNRQFILNSLSSGNIKPINLTIDHVHNYMYLDKTIKPLHSTLLDHSTTLPCHNIESPPNNKLPSFLYTANIPSSWILTPATTTPSSPGKECFMPGHLLFPTTQSSLFGLSKGITSTQTDTLPLSSSSSPTAKYSVQSGNNVFLSSSIRFTNSPQPLTVAYTTVPTSGTYHAGMTPIFLKSGTSTQQHSTNDLKSTNKTKDVLINKTYNMNSQLPVLSGFPFLSPFRNQIQSTCQTDHAEHFPHEISSYGKQSDSVLSSSQIGQFEISSNKINEKNQFSISYPIHHPTNTNLVTDYSNHLHNPYIYDETIQHDNSCLMGMSDAYEMVTYNVTDKKKNVLTNLMVTTSSPSVEESSLSTNQSPTLFFSKSWERTSPLSSPPTYHCNASQLPVAAITTTTQLM